MSNTFGNNFRVTTFGESHGTALGAIIDGCPAGLHLTKEDFMAELDRRKPGQSKITTKRQEPDTPEILSGIFEEKTLGTPIAVIVRNNDARSIDYDAMKGIFRPGHADKAWKEKFLHRDHRGGGRSSGRETIGRVVGGTVAKKLLHEFGTNISGGVRALGGIVATGDDFENTENNIVRALDAKAATLMIKRIQEIQSEGDSLGGIVEIRITNPPKSLGRPVFDKLQARIFQSIGSIGCVRGVEFGSGFSVTTMTGKESNQQKDGISGGMSTGEDIRLRIAVKPTPSIAIEQEMEDERGRNITFSIPGRHDPSVLPRFVPVAESMVALTLADAFLESPVTISTLKKTITTS